MKKVLYVVLIIFSIFLLSGCSKYEELNNLAIISNITIEYKDDTFIVVMQAMMPQKKENKVDYDYKYHSSSNKSLNKAFSNIIDHSPKKIYLRRVQNVIISYKEREKIMKSFLKYNEEKKNISKEASVVATKNNLDKFLKVNSDYKYIDSVLKNNKQILFTIANSYKKKRKIKLPLLKINDKEIIFSKFIYLQV